MKIVILLLLAQMTSGIQKQIPTHCYGECGPIYIYFRRPKPIIHYTTRTDQLIEATVNCLPHSDWTVDISPLDFDYAFTSRRRIERVIGQIICRKKTPAEKRDWRNFGEAGNNGFAAFIDLKINVEFLKTK